MRQLNGFSLIEQLVAITIFAILTVVAVPSYKHFMLRSVRADARATLYFLAQAEERYFTTNNTYLCFNATGCATTPTGWKNFSGNSYATRTYNVGVAPGTGTTTCLGQTATISIANSYVITATPYTTNFTDTECGNLTLDNCGNRGNQIGTLANCWQ